MALEVDGVNINAVEIDGQVLKTFEMDGNLLLAPPTITTQPVGATILDNQTRVISVVAQSLGKDIKYQWQRNGVNISGATGASYTHPAMAAGTYTYRCIISNKMGSITSNNAVITVNVSWAATHTLAVRYASVFGMYGFILGTETGDLQPRYVQGFPCIQLSVNPSTGDVHISLQGQAGTRTIRVEFGSSSLVANIVVNYDGYAGSWGSIKNSTICSWVAARNNQNIGVRIV